MSTASIEVPIGEAGRNLSHLIDRVRNGGQVTITRDDEAVARLVPVERRNWEAVAAAIAELNRLRAKSKATIAEIIDWKNEGRR